MRGTGKWLAAALMVAGTALAGCTSGTSTATEGAGKVAPAKVEAIAGREDVKKVTLTARAAERLAIKTVTIGGAPRPSVDPVAPVAQPESTASPTVVPYSAVLYHPNGTTWVYTVPQPLIYVREKVVVATVTGAQGGEAVLSQGPPAGTTIVSVGVVELWGAELGVGK